MGTLGKQDIGEVVRRYTSGESATSLAKSFCVTPKTIRARLKESGIRLRNRVEAWKVVADKTLNTRQASEIVRRYEQGESAMSLSKKFGVSHATCCKRIVEAGITLRSFQESMKIVDRKLTETERSRLASEYLSGTPRTIIARAYGVSEGLIRFYLKAQGVAPRTHDEVSRLKRKVGDSFNGEIRTRYECGESAASIAKALGYASGGVILNRLREIGISIRQSDTYCRRYSLNEGAFNSITEESAYWIGFLMADGCVHYTKRWNSAVISLCVAKYDCLHLENYKKFLGSNGKIYFGGKDNTAVFTITSHHIANALAKFGVLPRKSLTAKVIGLENNEDFWRGVIDGDGTVAKSSDADALLSLCGSRALMLQFATFVAKQTNTKPPTLYKQGHIFIVKLYGKRAAFIAELLYSGCSVALQRKLENAERIIQRQRDIDEAKANFVPAAVRYKVEGRCVDCGSEQLATTLYCVGCAGRRAARARNRRSRLAS
jgi:hypothetical protein